MQEKVILYGTDTCPKCGVLKALLAEKRIEAEKVSDFDVMVQEGINNIPMLEIRTRLTFHEATEWIKNHNQISNNDESCSTK